METLGFATSVGVQYWIDSYEAEIPELEAQFDEMKRTLPKLYAELEELQKEGK